MSYANRGKAFEKLIQFTNQQYKLKGWALIDQVPIPILITSAKGKEVKGIKTGKSTVDFIGLAHGRGIAFDAKSTKETTRFPLSNVHDHQVNYLKKFKEQGGSAFFLIHFEKLQETYFMDIECFLQWWDAAKEGGPKSIQYKDVAYFGQQVKSEKGIALHYLKYCS
jgi:recombination protein U